MGQIAGCLIELDSVDNVDGADSGGNTGVGKSYVSVFFTREIQSLKMAMKELLPRKRGSSETGWKH